MGCTSSRSISSTLGRKEKVAVIGAGMAGLTAGRFLNESGNCDVHIFEARSRIGGRMLTKTAVDNTPLEYGAAWIHGTLDNPIAELCKRFALAHVQTDSGKKLMYDNFVSIGEKAYADINAQFDAITKKIYREVQASDRPLSVEQGFRKYMPKSAKVQELIECLVKNNLVETYNGDANDLLANDMIEDPSDKTDDGGNHVLIQGYTPLVNEWSNGLNIKLNKPLHLVELKSQYVRLTFIDGTSEDFDRVIVTVPLSVLKAGHIQFDPPLPENKQRAIQNIGFGHFAKLFLTFPSAFWPKNTPWIEFNHKDPHRASQFFSMKDYTNSNTLVGTSGGSHAFAWQKMGKEKVAEMALAQLKKVFSSVPDPLFYDITTWSLQNETLGAYSYAAMTTQMNDRKYLEAPIQNRIFFAGEACEKENYASVHGAYMSGEKAALQILKKIK